MQNCVKAVKKSGVWYMKFISLLTKKDLDEDNMKIYKKIFDKFGVHYRVDILKENEDKNLTEFLENLQKEGVVFFIKYFEKSTDFANKIKNILLKPQVFGEDFKPRDCAYLGLEILALNDKELYAMLEEDKILQKHELEL